MNKERPRAKPHRSAENDPSPDRTGNCARCEHMAADDARDMEMLRELAELSMAMARAMQAQFMAQIGAQIGTSTPTDNPSAAGNNVAGAGNGLGGDPGLAFSRVARTVRQTIALKRRIADEAAARDAERAERDRQTADIAQSRIKERKRRVERRVRWAIANEADAGDRDYLYEDLREKLDAYEAEGAFDITTVNELIDLLMRELGITDEETEDDEAQDGADDGPEAVNDAAGPAPDLADNAAPLVGGRNRAGRGGRDPP